MDPNANGTFGYAFPTSSSIWTGPRQAASAEAGISLQQQKQPNKKKRKTAKNAQQQVKVPGSKEENRAIKESSHFVEEDNEDIAYLNFPLIWPLAIVSAMSVGFFLFAFSSMELIEHLSFERFALNQLLFTYGKTLGFCNNTFPYERGMWPSFLRQMEMKVLTNVCFRVAVCVPMAIRIFVAFVIRNSTREHALVARNPLLRLLNELTGPVAILESFSLSLFSIVTIRFDYPHFYNAMLGIFVFSASVHMFLRTALSFTADTPLAEGGEKENDHQQQQSVDQLAGAVRLLCTLVFAWTASQVFQFMQRFVHQTGCHGYVRPGEAITEYAAILSYVLFSLLHLVDVRNVRFICYPRSCSGECEPLRPEHFSPGGKFEHCRSFEWAQRQRNKRASSRNQEGIDYEEQFPSKFSAFSISQQNE